MGIGHLNSYNPPNPRIRGNLEMWGLDTLIRTTPLIPLIRGNLEMWRGAAIIGKCQLIFWLYCKPQFGINGFSHESLGMILWVDISLTLSEHLFL